MEIRCKKGNCKHNTGCSCGANQIDIDRVANCKSYVLDDIKQNLMIENGNIFEVAEELVAKNLKSVPLACHMKQCLYNKQEKCTANGITIIDENREKDGGSADCATFIER